MPPFPHFNDSHTNLSSISCFHVFICPSTISPMLCCLFCHIRYYLATFANQENTFVTLINGLFPNDDALDKSARKAMMFEAQSLFIALEDLRKAARIEDTALAEQR